MNTLMLVLLGVGQVYTGAVAKTPVATRELPLLHQSDFEYLGAFRVPHGSYGNSSFAYGGTAPAFNPANNSLFLVGSDQDQAVAEICIPEVVNTGDRDKLKTASILQPFCTLQSRIPKWTIPSAAKIGGLLVVDGKLIGTFYEYYDAPGRTVDSHFQLDSLNLATSTLSGLYQVGNYGGGFVGGYMTSVPKAWQSKLGTAFLTGQAGIPIISRTSAGPSAFGFDPNRLGEEPHPVVNFLSYPLSHALRPTSTTNPIFNNTTSITGILFPPDSRSVIFFGSHGTGSYCYGDSAACSDPVRPYKGPHSVGGRYEYQVWAYDVAELIHVRNGGKKAWEIQPYDVWTFDLPFEEPQKYIGGVAFDSATGRVYLSQLRADPIGYSPLPIIHVFSIARKNR